LPSPRHRAPPIFLRRRDLAAATTKRTFSLPDAQSHYIDTLVASGTYASGSEVVCRGKSRLPSPRHRAPPIFLRRRDLAVEGEPAVVFMLTRLVDWLNVPPGALVKPKDPLEYDRRLAFHRAVRAGARPGRRRSSPGPWCG
jgi:hypothetical protein